jgi:hypothetical protein
MLTKYRKQWQKVQGLPNLGNGDKIDRAYNGGKVI